MYPLFLQEKFQTVLTGLTMDLCEPSNCIKVNKKKCCFCAYFLNIRRRILKPCVFLSNLHLWPDSSDLGVWQDFFPDNFKD